MQQLTGSQASLTPSSQRPVPLRRRQDLDIEQISYGGCLAPVVKDPLALKYSRLSPEQFTVLKNLDGEHSLEDLRDELQAGFPSAHLTLSDVQSLILQLHELGLLTSERMRQGEVVLKKRWTERGKRLRQACLNPLFIRLPGWDPDAALNRIEAGFGWLFNGPALSGFSLFIAISWLFVAVHFDEIRLRLPEFQQFFGWPNLLYLWATLTCAKAIHEFGHGVACKHFGGECHAMGVALLIFSPTLYCDVTDSWMLKNKWQRILIGAAGMYLEMILAAMAILVWYNTQPGLIHHIALNVFFISTVTTVIFNANPLLRYDGYYMLADYLEIPNLQAKGDRALSQTFSHWVLNIEPPSDPFQLTTGRGWLMFYAIASSLYRWIVLFGVTLFLYTVLKPYRLQSLGILAACFSLLGILGSQFWKLFKMLVAPRRDPLSRIRISAIILVLAGVVAAFLFVPVPWYEEAAFYVEPAGVQHVYSYLPGTVEQVAVASGEDVHTGQLLLQMSSPELIDRADRLQTEIHSQQVELKLYRTTRDPEGGHLAQQRLSALQQQLEDVEEQQQELQLLAPVAGRIVDAPRVPIPDFATNRQRLPTWNGTALETRNLGQFLEPGTHVCSIAPGEDFQAVVLIGQSDRGDLQVGDRVRLKFDALPEAVFAGTVTSFSSRQRDYAPASLSNKSGGPMATVTDSHGREKLQDAVYQASVDLIDPPPSLRSGMRGSVRFVVSKRTLFSWLSRSFRTMFHFRI